MEKAIQLIKNSSYIVSKETKKQIEQNIRATLNYKNIRQIILLPEQTNLANKTVCVALGIIGWTLWTAMDRIRDKQDYSQNKLDRDLVTFSILRPIIDDLLHQLNLTKLKFNQIRNIVGTMEYANSKFCKLHLRQQYILKSIGVAIPMLIFLMKNKASKKDTDLCYKYFYHLIGSRQLSDDACDWHEDIKEGHKTLVTEWLIDNAGKNKSYREYIMSFCKTVSPKVANEILWHSRLSRSYARRMKFFKSTKFLEELPQFYEEMALRILAECNKNKHK